MKFTQETELHIRFRKQIGIQIQNNPAADYLTKNWQGRTCIHLAAAFGGLEYIPKEILTVANITAPDYNGDSSLHIAAKSGNLDQFTINAIPRHFFSQKNNQGENVFDLATAHGNLESIPDSIRIWNPRCLLSKVSEWCALGGHGSFPTELLDSDLWTLPVPTGVSQHTTALHIVAERRMLHHLPLSLTGQGAMLLENGMGETPLSVVIARGDLKENLERIPLDFSWDMHAGLPGCPTYYHLLAEHRQIGLLDHIPDQSYFLKDRTGKTVLDLLFQSGEIEIAPEHVRWHQRDYREKKSKELLSAGKLDDLPKDFDWVDEMSDGMTPLHYAASEGLLHFLPVEFLSENNLTTKDHNGRNVATTAFESGNIQEIPEDLRHLAKGYAESLLRKAIEGGSLADLPSWVKSPEYLLRKCNALAQIYLETYLHRIAATGLLGQIPPNCIQPIHLKERDWDRNTVLHTLVTSGHAHTAPALWFSEPEVLGVKNADGASVYELAAVMPMLGSVPVPIFTKEVLLTNCGSGKTLADLIEEHGNTPLLPPELRNFSKARAVTRLKECFSMDFVSAVTLHSSKFSELLTLEQFQFMRLEFVREWFARHPDLSLDEEQGEAVAECGSHIQVTARAGSGKTRTLVARSLFQIQHCRIPSSSILILAFNKKAVEEIRERLSKVLSEEQMPHVLTFHALAYRIVRPEEDLIFDEGETKEGQVFSTTIQRIIDDGMRGGTLEKKLRELMEARWNADLNRIISLGFNLPLEEFLAHRANLSRTTMNGRRVDTEAHKHIGNALLRLGLRYSYRRGIHRSAGTAYEPDFSHYHKETDQRFLIEVLGEDAAQANVARQAFWNSDRSANAHLIQISAADCQDAEVTLEGVARELANRGFAVSPMSDDELWLALRDDIIRDFTKAVRGFISRCQKELIPPERLDRMLPDSDPELWSLRKIGENRYIKEPTVEGMQVRFWRLCSGIYRQYRQVLAESHQTDFDQLMLDAAGMIREGNTGFSSDRGRGDIRQIRHLLIDEYQDFSHLFDELRKSIIAQSPDANFFCVGDDWQAINKFAGSDLRYFAGFTETFEPSVRKLITRNYRSCRKIVEIGNRVMHGQGEPSVPNSSEQGNTWRVEVGAYGNLSEAEEIVIEELGDDALSILRIASDCTSRGESVAILSRTSSVATPEGMPKLERWQERLRSFLPEKDRGLLEASTTHGYKGKEADVVILLDPEAYPFVHPDAIFTTIFGDTFKSIQDDEKRLFYVGVTRPKKTLYLLSYPSRYSKERPYRIRFLEGAYPPAFDINRLQSNLLCGSRVVVRLTNRPGTYGNGGTFPIKDQLKASEFKWNEDRKIWSIFLERGLINSPFECLQYLTSQPWIRNADGIVASFAWEDQKHRFRIDRGQVFPDTTTASGAENPAIMGGQRQPVPVQPPPTVPRTFPHPSPATPTNTSAPGGTGSFETNVAGMRYEGRMGKADHLRAGDDLTLQREPSNSHDRNAIAVWTDEGVQIGYLSRHVAAHLASALDAQGGFWGAKVSSVWKQPPPHFMVSIQISLKLPPGVSMPVELSASTSAADSPFESPRHPSIPPTPIQKAAPPPAPQAPKEPEAPPPILATPQTPVVTPQAPPPVSGSLTPAQDNELDLLGDPRLRPIITALYLSGSCPWPVIGYEGQDSTRHCTDSMLEVAWPDQKIGIYLPTSNVSSFAATGWVILPAAAVSAEMLRSILSNASGQATSPQTTPQPVISPQPNTYQAPPTRPTIETFDDDDDDDIPF
jgi:DNA helicase-4